MVRGPQGRELHEMLDAEPSGSLDHGRLDAQEVRIVASEEEETRRSPERGVTLPRIVEVRPHASDWRERLSFGGVAVHRAHLGASHGEQADQLAADRSRAAGDGDQWVTQ